MNSARNGANGNPGMLEVDVADDDMDAIGGTETRAGAASPELKRSLADIKGQAQFLLYLADQIQLQYDRNVTERVTFTGALRALRIVGVSSNLYGDNRNYFQGNLFLKWMITRTWFVQGGYVYTWQKYQTDTGSADNNLIMIKFGYQGLPRQR